MATLIPHSFEILAPNEAERLLAGESSRFLASRPIGEHESVMLRIVDNGEETETVSVPTSAIRLFIQLLSEMSHGNAVTIIPTESELTTQQAADLLKVSRPYVVKLLDEGKIPSRTVGKYRRVRFHDLMNYKRKDDEYRARILDKLTAEAQELGMGY